MSTEYSSSTLTSPSSEWTESTLSSDSWSSESIDITSDGGSDSTDFTPGEFVDYPRLPHPSSSSRPNSGSSDTIHAGGGPYVARITVTAPANHSFTSTSPVRERAGRPRSEVVVAPLLREQDAPVQTYNCEVPFKHPKTTRNEWSPNSPVTDRNINNGTAHLVEPYETSAPRKDNCKVPYKYAKTWEDERTTSSAVRGSMSRDGTVGLVEKRIPERAVSAKCGSPLKHPTKRMSTTNSNCFFVSPASDRVTRHTMPPQVADGDVPTCQMNNGEAFVKCGRKSNNDNSSSFTTEDRSSHHRSVSSTASSAVELEASVCRKSRRTKQPTSCSVTSSSGGCPTNSRSTIVGDSGVVGHDGPGRRKNGRESGSKNDEEHHRNRNLSGKGRDVTHRRGSGGSNAIIKDAAFHRCCAPDAESSSKYPGDVLCSSAADNRVEAPRQGFDRADQKRTPVNQHVTGTETSERAMEQDRWHQAKAAQMKRYCLEQLKLPSKSIPEVARRRRGKQRRMIAGEISGSPDRLLAMKSGAQAAPREYASRHEYPLYSTTTTRDSVSPPITDDASKMSSGKTLCQQQSLINTRDNKYVSETLDGHRGRIWTDNSDRKRKVLEQPSPEEDRPIRASIAARTDCSSASGRANTVSRGGRLSVTITSNEPEPEIHWAINVGRMTLPSLEAECLRNVRPGNGKETYSGQIYDSDVINRKYIQARKNSASTDSDDDYNCWKSSSSSEATVRDIGERESEETRSTRRKEYFRRRYKRTSRSSGHSCVDAAVQVEVEELKRKDRYPSSCLPTSERDSGVKSLSADSDWTDTGYSPESESSSSKYFRRSGKDVWRASMALQSSHRKGSADVQSETSRTNSEQSTTTKTSRRRHRNAEHQEHLANTRLINNHREKTAEVLPIVDLQTSQTSSINWTNEAEITAKEKRMTTMGKDDGTLGEIFSGIRNHSGDPRTGHGCRKTVEDQMSNVQIESSVGLLDSSLVDVVVQNGCRQELDRVANRISSLGVDDTSEEQAKYEIAKDRSGEIRQRGLDRTRVEGNSVITGNISNGPTGTCGQLPEFTQKNCDTARNTDSLRSTPGSHHSLSSSLDTSLVDVVAERRVAVAKEQGMVARKDATSEPLETAGQRNMTDTAQLSDHRRRDNLQQGRQSSNDLSSKSCQRGIAETCHRETSLTTPRKENFHQGNTDDMTSTDHKPNRELSSCPPDALLQQVSSPPERPTFFSRLFNRWLL